MSARKIYENCTHGYTPLQNEKNTCYCNAVMQAVTHNSVLAKSFASGAEGMAKLMKTGEIFSDCGYDPKPNEKGEHHIQCALHATLYTFFKYGTFRKKDGAKLRLSEGCILACRKLFWNPKTASELQNVLTDQQCCSEFLNHVVTKLLNNPHEFDLSELFEFKVQDQTNHCKNCNRNFFPEKENDQILSINVFLAVPETDCGLEKLLLNEINYRDAQCDDCKEIYKVKRIIVRAPPVLAVTVMRSTYNADTGEYVKVNNPLKIPESFMINTLTDGEVTFHRPAMIVHRGNSPFSGHYVTYAPGQDGFYYLADDLAGEDDGKILTSQSVFEDTDEIGQNCFLALYEQKGHNGVELEGIEEKDVPLIQESSMNAILTGVLDLKKRVDKARVPVANPSVQELEKLVQENADDLEVLKRVQHQLADLSEYVARASNQLYDRQKDLQQRLKGPADSAIRTDNQQRQQPSRATKKTALTQSERPAQVFTKHSGSLITADSDSVQLYKDPKKITSSVKGKPKKVDKETPKLIEQQADREKKDAIMLEIDNLYKTEIFKVEPVEVKPKTLPEGLRDRLPDDEEEVILKVACSVWHHKQRWIGEFDHISALDISKKYRAKNIKQKSIKLIREKGETALEENGLSKTEAKKLYDRAIKVKT